MSRSAVSHAVARSVSMESERTRNTIGLPWLSPKNAYGSRSRLQRQIRYNRSVTSNNVLPVPIAPVARTRNGAVAKFSRRRQTGHGIALATGWSLEVLAEGGSKAQAWTAAARCRGGEFDRTDEPVQFPLGCTSNPRRTAQAGAQGFGGDCGEIHGSSLAASWPGLACVSAKRAGRAAGQWSKC
jgi:hypothetical protein